MSSPMKSGLFAALVAFGALTWALFLVAAHLHVQTGRAELREGHLLAFERDSGFAVDPAQLAGYLQPDSASLLCLPIVPDLSDGSCDRSSRAFLSETPVAEPYRFLGPDFTLRSSAAEHCNDDTEQPPCPTSGARALIYSGTLGPAEGQEDTTADVVVTDLGGSFGYHVTIATPR